MTRNRLQLCAQDYKATLSKTLGDLMDLWIKTVIFITTNLLKNKSINVYKLGRLTPNLNTLYKPYSLEKVHGKRQFVNINIQQYFLGQIWAF